MTLLFVLVWAILGANALPPVWVLVLALCASIDSGRSS